MSFSSLAHDKCVRVEIMVSILVLVDVFLQYRIDHLPMSPNQVSILVLVDVFLQSSATCYYSPGHESFNPCFSGCLSPVATKLDLFLDIQSFNPCFSGCLSPVKGRVQP